jgi:hypothetical protein
MSDVKRYDCNGRVRPMQENPEGPWVMHSDYAALRARLEAVEKRAYWLAIVIMGGEDAPGYADSIETNVLVYQLRRERRTRDAWTDACVKAALATAQRDALEEAAQFVESHEVGVNPRTGYVVAPSMIEGTQGTHAGMAYATAIRTLAAFDTTGGKDE